MATKTIAAGDFKQTCLKLIEQVRTTGVAVVITKHGRPVAQLAPLEPSQIENPWPAELASAATIHGDLAAPASEPAEWNVLSD